MLFPYRHAFLQTLSISTIVSPLLVCFVVLLIRHFLGAGGGGEGVQDWKKAIQGKVFYLLFEEFKHIM